jgi:hypothetical protein
MADDDDNSQTPPAAAAPPPATPSEGSDPPSTDPPKEDMIPKSKVEEMIRDRLERDRRSRQKAEPKAPPPKKDEPRSEKVDDSDIRERVEFRDALDDMTDEMDWKPSREDRGLLRDMYRIGGTERMAALAERLQAQSTASKGDDKPPAAAPAAAAPAAPPPSPPTVTPGGSQYKPPPGAPNAPTDIVEQNPAKWSPDYIDRLKQDGTFRQEVEKFYQTGEGGLFRRRIPKG